MMEALADWVRTLAVAAVFCAVVLLLIPEGSEKRAVKFTCACLLTLLLIRPLRELDPEHLTRLMTEQKLRQTSLEENAEELSREVCSGIIRREAEEYIWDAAVRLGIGRLGIRMQLRTVSGIPCPWSVELTGEATQQQREQLSLLLEGELGIPGERQTWSFDDAG
jgi:hypothetical protein